MKRASYKHYVRTCTTGREQLVNVTITLNNTSILKPKILLVTFLNFYYCYIIIMVIIIKLSLFIIIIIVYY